MQNIHPLLSDYLEELKEFKEGAFLDKTISIFYNDWPLNHRLINELVKTTTTADCEQVKAYIIDLNFLIDKLHIEDSELLVSEVKE